MMSKTSDRPPYPFGAKGRQDAKAMASRESITVPQGDGQTSIPWRLGVLAASLLIGMLALDASAADQPFAGVTLNDHRDQPHQLSTDVPGRLVMLFAIESRVDGKAWDERLTPHLPADRQLIRVMDAGAVRVDDRPRLLERVRKALDGTAVVFLMDWDGVVRKQLGGTPDQVVIVAIDAAGAVSGRTGGLPTAANLTTALGYLGIVPDPPLQDQKPANPKTDARPTP